MKVKEILFTKTPSISKDEMAAKARAVMRQNSVRALPVFDGEKLIGVITRSDIAKITSTKSNMTIGGLLWKSLVSVDAERDILDAAKILLKDDLKQLPIMANGKYVGMIRDVDILKWLLAKKAFLKKKTVREVMTSRVKTYSADESITKVWGSISEHGTYPVIQASRVVGIISTKELLESRKARIERESKTVKTPAKVGHVMRIVVGEESRFFIHPDAPIEKAIKKMLESELSILIVAEKANKLIGIVTRKDLLKAYL